MSNIEKNHREDPATMPTVSNAWDKSVAFHSTPSYLQPKPMLGKVKHQSLLYSFDSSTRAFGNDLQLGRVVWGRLSGAVADYSKESTVHPLLVTGLWRRGEDIEKIEVMRYSMNRKHASNPDRFRLDTLDLIEGMASKHGGTLKTADVTILDNNEGVFPSCENMEDCSIKAIHWPEVLVRRAYGIMYYKDREITGYNPDAMHGLEREGFFFRKIPATAIAGNAFVPEAMTDGVPTDILPQKLVDMVAYYSACYAEEKRVGGRQAYFDFPPMAEWKMEITPADYPNWTTPELRARGRVSYGGPSAAMK